MDEFGILETTAIYAAGGLATLALSVGVVYGGVRVMSVVGVVKDITGYNSGGRSFGELYSERLRGIVGDEVD